MDASLILDRLDRMEDRITAQLDRMDTRISAAEIKAAALAVAVENRRMETVAVREELRRHEDATTSIRTKRDTEAPAPERRPLALSVDDLKSAARLLPFAAALAGSVFGVSQCGAAQRDDTPAPHVLPAEKRPAPAPQPVGADDDDTTD